MLASTNQEPRLQTGDQIAEATLPPTAKAPSPPTTEDTDAQPTNSMVPILVVVIAAVGVALIIYIAYHNRDTVSHFY
jgi:hypothetical protein